jgi:hypothetical protein
VLDHLDVWTGDACPVSYTRRCGSRTWVGFTVEFFEIGDKRLISEGIVGRKDRIFE